MLGMPDIFSNMLVETIVVGIDFCANQKKEGGREGGRGRRGRGGGREGGREMVKLIEMDIARRGGFTSLKVSKLCPLTLAHTSNTCCRC